MDTGLELLESIENGYEYLLSLQESLAEAYDKRVDQLTTINDLLKTQNSITDLTSKTMSSATFK
jgi:hypothetical protein